MSGHSKWSTIKHKKAANDSARGSVFTKMAKGITIAVEKGGGIGDPDKNFSLRLAVDKARSVNMPKENIDRAIDKGMGKSGNELVELKIEGFGPEGVGVIIEAITDSRNRTVAEIRTLMERHGGRMGEMGCVEYMFDKHEGHYTPKYCVETSKAVAEFVKVLCEHDDVQEVMPIWDRGKINPKGITLTKRRKFLLVSILLSFGLLVVQRLPVESRYSAIAFFALAAYLLTAWSLLKDLHGTGWVVNLILPTMYPVSVALFYFLLPQAALTRTIVVLLFGISMYALLLTVNIFAVARIRTIQLLRAARAVGFLLSILTSAFLFHVIFSLHVAGYLVGLLVLAVSLPILWQGTWSYVVSDTVKREFYYGLVGAMVIAQMATALSFWLISVPLASVLLAMGMYVTLGLFQHDLEGRLFARTIQEYVGFAGIVVVVVVVAAVFRWMR
jgi:transcriptional/translational regulatory protein YebC/TACO1